MKTLDELRAYHESHMRPRLEVLDAERRRYAPHFVRYLRWVLLAWAALSGALLAFGRTEELMPVGVVTVFVVVGIVLWRGIRYLSRAMDLSKRCKAEVVVPMLRWLAPELDYDPEGHVAFEVAEHSNLIRPHDRLEGEDHFRGRIGQTELEFCELVVHWHTVERTKEGRKERHHQEHGLFLVASGNKPFAGETRIYPDYMEAVLGDTAARALSAKHRGDLQLIHLEDPAFENLFRVYASDPVEAHYILTPSLMARLTSYRERHKRDVSLSFQDSQLYAYFPPTLGERAALFDLVALGDMLDFERVQLMHEELVMMLGIVEELNLNTRIWGEPQQAEA